MESKATRRGPENLSWPLTEGDFGPLKENQTRSKRVIVINQKIYSYMEHDKTEIMGKRAFSTIGNILQLFVSLMGC